MRQRQLTREHATASHPLSIPRSQVRDLPGPSHASCYEKTRDSDERFGQVTREGPKARNTPLILRSSSRTGARKQHGDCIDAEAEAHRDRLGSTESQQPPRVVVQPARRRLPEPKRAHCGLAQTLVTPRVVSCCVDIDSRGGRVARSGSEGIRPGRGRSRWSSSTPGSDWRRRTRRRRRSPAWVSHRPATPE
jgi:hypothetical protein